MITCFITTSKHDNSNQIINRIIYGDNQTSNEI